MFVYQKILSPPDKEPRPLKRQHIFIRIVRRTLSILRRNKHRRNQNSVIATMVRIRKNQIFYLNASSPVANGGGAIKQWRRVMLKRAVQILELSTYESL